MAAVEAGEGDLEELISRHPEHASVLHHRLELLGLWGVGAAQEDTGRLAVPGYTIERLLGRGGMGEVWLATEDVSNDSVALKLLRPSSTAPSLILRFRREAAALSRLDHPSIVAVRAAGDAGGVPFLAMEYIEGRDLGEVVASGSASVGQLVRWAREIADALVVAHAAGILHRDVKPSNIRVTPEGRAVLIDFGLTGGVDKSSLSMTGRFLGSPHYASPEQLLVDREGVGPASDVYSLGVTLYEALAGCLPFDAPTSPALFRRILTDEAPDLRHINPDVTPDLAVVIGRAMEKRLRDRYPDAKSFRDDLDAVLELRRVAAKPPGFRRRFVRLVRRHPAPAAALLVLIVLLITVGAVSEVRRRAGLRARTAQARSLVSRAWSSLNEYERQAEGLPDLLRRFADGRRALLASTPDAEATARFDTLMHQVETAKARSDLAFVEVLETLAQAEDLDPEVAGAKLVRTRLYFERWRGAHAKNDESLSTFFAERVRELDGPEGEWARKITYQPAIDLAIEPAAARVDAFYYQRLDHLQDGAEPRLVAVPQGGASADAMSGALALRVTGIPEVLHPEDLIVEIGGHPIEGIVFVGQSTSGEVHPGERILGIDDVPPGNAGFAEELLAGDDTHLVRLETERGSREVSIHADELSVTGPAAELMRAGGEVTVWRDGLRFRARVDPGISVRPTRSPLWHGPESYVGTGSLRGAQVFGDPVLLLIRCDGYQPLRIPITDPEVLARPMSVTLQPLGTIPPPFVQVVTSPGDVIYIMDREVTVGEYLGFLNDESGLRDVPLSLVLPQSAAEWTIEDGRARPPRGLGMDFPITAVSWSAAQAYAEWRTRQALAAGHAWRFSLPSGSVWRSAAGWLPSRWKFPWGASFRPTFCKSCFARKRPRLEPGLRFPIDETLSGLMDTAGGVAEFASDWFWEEQRQRAICGGSWVHGDPKIFDIQTGTWGAPENTAFEFVGMRLILSLE